MPVLAQQADPATLDGVRVTGSKRDTPYLKSDLSVTVLDRQALKEAGVTEFRDLDKLAPNVKFNAMGQLSNMFISIRGIESNPFLVNRASVYIDGIPFRELSNAVLNQVESVEVLRGPRCTVPTASRGWCWCVHAARPMRERARSMCAAPGSATAMAPLSMASWQGR